MSTSTSVGEDFPREQARVREIQQHARDIGPAGAFLVMMTEQALRAADQAMASGDTVAIVRAYSALKEFQE